jgi:hypothetical protein
MTGLRVDRVDSNTFGPAVVTLSTPPAAGSSGAEVKALTARLGSAAIYVVWQLSTTALNRTQLYPTLLFSS